MLEAICVFIIVYDIAILGMMIWAYTKFCLPRKS